MSEWQEDGDDDGAHFAHFVPDAWRASWDFSQILPMPSRSTKRAAESLLHAERVQQGLGWLLLISLTVTLGFIRVMPRTVCWLTWAIFMLELGVKLARRWGLACCFQDVPCAYVPVHQVAAKKFIVLFGRGLLVVTLLELGLSVGYIYAIAHEWTRWADGKSPYDQSMSPYSAKKMLEFITATGFLILLHSLANCVVLLRFNDAMTLGRASRIPSRQQLVGRYELERSLCLTWWVHIARHRHLSASEAMAQTGECGLPGQWYESVLQLKKILEQSTVVGNLPDVSLVWLSQDMAMRALLSIAIQGHVESCQLLLEDDGFRLLLLVLSEGKPESSRGLAAAAIGELADHEVIESEGVKLAAAVLPLKRLARSHVVDLKEMALGALLNLTLNVDQRSQVVAEILSARDDEYLGSEGAIRTVGTNSANSFVDLLLHSIRRGPTTLCQVLGAGLLVRLSANVSVRDAILRQYPVGSGLSSNLELFVRMLKIGLTDEVQASVAGLLWELAYWDAKAVGDDPQGDRCLHALVSSLWGEPQVAAAAAGAIASLAFNSAERKRRIMDAEGSLEGLVRLLRDGSNYKMRHGENQRNSKKVLAQGQAQAARALRILAASNDENQDLIVHAGAISEIVKLLQKENSYLHMQAAATLDAISHRNKRVQDFVGSNFPEVFSRLTQLLDPVRHHILGSVPEKVNHQQHIMEMVLEKAALAVRSIAEGHRANRERFLEAGAKERLQSILIRHRERDSSGSKLCNVVEKALGTLQ